MLKKYLAKFAVDILPSVAATVIGAYIVNHYIVSKPGPGAPVAAAVSTADPKAAPEAAKTDAKAKTPDKHRHIRRRVNARGPGVKAKGISERAILEKTAAESRPRTSPRSRRRPLPSRPRRGGISLRRVKRLPPGPLRRLRRPPRRWYRRLPRLRRLKPRALRKSAATPTILRARRSIACAVRTMVRRDRRKPPARRTAGRAFPDAARIPDAPRVVLAPAVRPLPPPILVSTPARETVDSTTGSSEMKPPYAAAARNDDPRRPTPPAEIPSPPLDLRAEASGP